MVQDGKLKSATVGASVGAQTAERLRRAVVDAADASVDSWRQASFDELPAISASLGWSGVRRSEDTVESIYEAVSGLATEVMRQLDVEATSVSSVLESVDPKMAAPYIGGYAQGCADIAGALLEAIHSSRREVERRSKRDLARTKALELLRTRDFIRPRDVMEACEEDLVDLDAPTVSRALADLMEHDLIRKSDDVPLEDARASAYTLVSGSIEE